MLYSFLLVVFVFHYLGDWLFQTRWMADNKSKRIDALLLHLLTYGLTLSIGVFIWSYINLSYEHYDLFTLCQLWVLVNIVFHGITDKISSHFTGKLYRAGNIHAFFAVIGFDGMIHYVTLLVSAKLIIGV